MNANDLFVMSTPSNPKLVVLNQMLGLCRALMTSPDPSVAAAAAEEHASLSREIAKIHRAQVAETSPA